MIYTLSFTIENDEVNKIKRLPHLEALNLALFVSQIVRVRVLVARCKKTMFFMEF